MATVKLKVFVIRDTEENKVMEGAKGQLAFNSHEKARRSIPHCDWWIKYKKDYVVSKLMLTGKALTWQRDTLLKVVKQEDWEEHGKRASEVMMDITREINTWIATSREYKVVHSKTTFDTQSRYVVESVSEINTTETT
jgi:hypothetical protein